MKRWLAMFGLAVAALGVGYWVAGQRHAGELTGLTNARGSNLLWLRNEFNLTDEQFAAVSAAHRGYAAVCTRHCADILAARQNLEDVRDHGADVAVAEEQLQKLEQVCNDATLAHVRRVAGLMPPEAGKRFLALVEPHLATQPHDGDRGLDR